MKSRILWLLLGLNIGLGLMLVLGHFRENTAEAQRVLRPSDYLLIPAEVTGTNQGVVYIVDSSNGALGAMTFEDSKKSLLTMPYLDLNRIFSGQAGGR